MGIEFTDEKIINYSGLKLVNDILNKTDLKKRLNDIPHHGNSARKSEIIYTAIFLLSMGKINFENINEFRNDESYKIITGFNNVVSEAGFRQNLDKIGKTIENILLEENIKIIKNNDMKLTPYYKEYCPLDLDVTPMDNSNSNKEGVAWTYKKFMGYAPMMAYLGEEGYLINTELRKGSQHCQLDTKEVLTDKRDEYFGTKEIEKTIEKNGEKK